MQNRRQFMKTLTVGATAAMPYLWSCDQNISKPRPIQFRSYRSGITVGKVNIVTPDDGYYIHTFYDVCPWSPSGRYLAVTKVPFQDRDPSYGETADVAIIDLYNETIQTIYTSKAWGFQLGANLNWGTTDRFLYTNDIINGQGVCARIDLKSHQVSYFSGPMTHMAPDESHVLGFPLDLINASQRGYGIPKVPGKELELPKVGKPMENQGIWKTDMVSDESTLITSIADFYEKIPNPKDFANRAFYLFFSKYNRQGTRCLEFVRGVIPDPKPGQRRWMQMAMSHKPDGSDIVPAVTFGVHPPTNDWRQWRPDWKPGGHHITWAPDGEHLTKNLVPDGVTMRFCYFKYDGSQFKILSETHVGSGHPSMHQSTRYLIADVYAHRNAPAFDIPDGKVPIRLIDLSADKEEWICTVYTRGKAVPKGGTLRCDPHPCWSRDGKHVCFNGAPNDRRQVFIADLTGII